MLALSTVACAPDIDPQSELKGLRVLAVQKDKPYAKPSDSVTLTILTHDVDGPRPLQYLWAGGCRNPPGDLFYSCFQDLPAFLDPAFQGKDKTFTLNNVPGNDGIPDDIITTRPPPPDPRFPRYGLVYVFFAVCAGKEILPVPQTDKLAFPLGCFAEDGTQLGPRDFVAGYTSIYVYDDFTNTNPTPIDEFRVAGQPVADINGTMDLVCVNCTEPPTEPPLCEGSSLSSHCIQACPEDGERECPEIPILPVIDPSQAELDSVSALAYGRDVGEHMWINYYLDRGSVDSVARLVNDATKGWNPDFGTKLRAPAAPGPLNIWAVVHDNRGGVGWSRVTLMVF
jgi:hypothetical protein